MNKKYEGYAIDRFSSLPTRKTRKYSTEFEAHKAAEKLCKKYFSGDRGMVKVECVLIAD